MLEEKERHIWKSSKYGRAKKKKGQEWTKYENMRKIKKGGNDMKRMKKIVDDE